MAYLGRFRDIVYANEQRELRVVTYRLALLEEEPTAAVVIHLRRAEQPRIYEISSEREFDVVINRIIDTELRGVRVDSMRLVVESNQSSIEYPLDFNAAEVPAQRARIQPWLAAAELRSRDIVGGSVALFVDVEAGRPIAAWLKELLRG